MTLSQYVNLFVLYPRWFLPNWSLTPREVPTEFKWTETAFVTAPCLAILGIINGFLVVLGLHGGAAGPWPILLALVLHVLFGVYFFFRSYFGPFFRLG